MTLPHLSESTKDGQHSFADLAEKVAKLLYSREFFEQRHENFEDDCLIGLLNLMSHILKHDPPFKTSANGLGLIDQVSLKYFNIERIMSPNRFCSNNFQRFLDFFLFPP